MKKYTLVFATLLAMSGMAFGQKEGKVLWENLVESKPLKISSGKEISIGSFSTPFVSSSGNSLISYSYGYYGKGTSNYENYDANVYIYDKKGQMLLKVRGNYRNPSGSSLPADYRNKNYHTLYGTVQQTGTAYRDSIIFLDKDLKFQKGFDVRSGSTSLLNVEDGVFYSNPQNTLLKYDINAKEEWRFESKDAIEIVTQKPPYLGLISAGNENKSIVLFDKKGNKKGETSPQPIANQTFLNFNTFFVTNDNGFWLNTSPDLTKARLIRFDSTGKELVNISLVSVLTTFSNVDFKYGLLPDNSLVLTYLDVNYEMNIVKIDEKGKVNRIQKDLGIKAEIEANQAISTASPFIEDLKIAQNGAMKFNIYCKYVSKSDANIISSHVKVFGVEKFDDLKFGWNKSVKSAVQPPVIDISSEDNVFQVTSSYFSGKGNNFKYGEANYYELDGKFKWSYSNVSINQFLRKGNQVYAYQTLLSNNGLSSLYVLDYDTGKMLWKKEDITIYYILPYQSDIKIDKLGNTYLQFYKTENTTTKLNFQVIKRDGTVLWQYNSSNYINAFELDNDGGIIATTFEYSNSDLKYFIRKISPCNDLNAISITGKTEACPTEKVKLSIPKEDGLTYQWQKDGKDIPNVKDVVYDFGESGTYTVVAKDELCQNSVTSNALKVNIRTLPKAEITAPKSIFCEGEKTVMTATTNGTFFQWQKDQKDIPNATSGIYEVSEAGNYQVGVRDDKCPQVGYSNVYTIITKLLPEANISTDIKGVVYEPFTVKMTASSGTGLAYQWLKDDVIIPNETSLTYEAKKSGKYKVNVTYDGCTKLSDALTISILIPLANQEEIGEEHVQIYPNPSKGEFKIILPKSLKSADIQVFDSFGRERSLIYAGEQAQAEGLTQGVYFLRVQKGEKIVMNKIVIE
jgi:Secretion system C-terminal sorting domain